MQPGRHCPLHYRYAPEAIATAPAPACDTLYAIGGLYGNEQALAAVLDMAAAEAGAVSLVFNGDFNWFNVDPGSFVRVNEAVLGHAALRGNVETEIASAADAAGCGCGYPAWVSDAEVECSNAIMARLRDTGRSHRDLAATLAQLPMYRAAEVAGVRVALVHGDAESLAGWGYAQEALAEPTQRQAIGRHFERAQVRVIASSHTCLPVLADCDTARGRCVIVNNGAAGMPNFRGARYGIVTRIGAVPAPRALAPLYGTTLDGLHIDALPVRYDHDAWLRAFAANWGPGTPAHHSYYERIVAGPRYAPAAAVRCREASIPAAHNAG